MEAVINTSPSPTSGGYFRITPVNSGKAVIVYGASTADGAHVLQWTYNGASNEQWQLVGVFNNLSVTGLRVAATPEALAVDSVISGGTVVYPNPITGNSFFIKTGKDLSHKDILINIYNVDGVRVMSK